MGVGPAVAIPAVCEKAGVAIQDIDVIELNEAFASQAVYVIETLGLDENKINLNGGAIAIGHRTFPAFKCRIYFVALKTTSVVFKCWLWNFSC